LEVGVWSAASVFVCALELLGRTETSFPHVELIEKAPPGISPLAAGYVLLPEKRIVIITSTAAFRQARQASQSCNDVEAIREIASVLVHEEWHLTHGPDEAGAYDAQMIALLAAGADPLGTLFHKIKRAKLATLAASKRTTKTGVAASGQTVAGVTREGSP
jgi:hypothetical protein